MTLFERNYVVAIIGKEGIDYGLKDYTDFKGVGEVQDANFHEIRRKYIKADRERKPINKAKCIVELTKLLNSVPGIYRVDLFSNDKLQVK